MTRRTKAYLLLLLVSTIWGIAGPVIKFVLNSGLPPQVFLLYRFAISSAIGLVALSVSPFRWPTSASQKLSILVYCFLTSTVSLGLLFLGYSHTTATTASILNAVYPILVAIAGAMILHEKVTSREKLGLTIALAGTLLITLGAPSTETLVGNLLVLASLVVGVVLAISAKLLLRGSISPTGLTHLSFLVGFVTLLPLTLFHYPLSTVQYSITMAPFSVHLGVWYMALLSGTVAYSLWHRAQKTIEAGETAVFSYTYPIFTLPLSLFWLKESISVAFIASCLVIVLGILIAEIKPGQGQKSRRPALRPARRR